MKIALQIFDVVQVVLNAIGAAFFGLMGFGLGGVYFGSLISSDVVVLVAALSVAVAAAFVAFALMQWCWPVFLRWAARL